MNERIEKTLNSVYVTGTARRTIGMAWMAMGFD